MFKRINVLAAYVVFVWYDCMMSKTLEV